MGTKLPNPAPPPDPNAKGKVPPAPPKRWQMNGLATIVPARTMSPDALALAAEWWRVEEMGKEWNFGRLFCQPTDPSTKWGVVLWCGDIKAPVPSSFSGRTPAAAIIAAHEAWKKEQGK